ncbi:snRNA-activating protein complex subunit 1 [Toxorhynchites rutilus septentrionalis]|uniref:snRNA-activating protein complex subunit 1 n=1 Tax=Toxorhynchites rutilus septentrionalis TaxID=329112 RepID=UPI00247AFA6F|nr:snRNA-activating protein complex subunit 1 [Toxorhynchites rutilus septentrionalis]
MVSELSYGFREDCFAFLNEFSKQGSLEFRYFCQEWKKMNFQYVFYGRNTDFEMVEFVNEALLIVKQIFLCSKKHLEKVGAFYLLYALYFKQPTGLFCKIRLTLSDLCELKRFSQCPLPEQYSPEVATIFWKLFVGDAFRFVQDNKEYGYDGFFIKGLQSNRYDDKVRESFKVIKEAERDFRTMKSATGLFTALDALEMGYNEMKESLDETEMSVSSSDKIPQSNLMMSLHKDLNDVLAILNADEPISGAGEDNPSDEFATYSGENIGAKRSSLRERAFKRKVNKKDLQIATSINAAMVGSSPSSRARALRPRATKKRDANISVLNDDESIADMVSTDGEESAV